MVSGVVRIRDDQPVAKTLVVSLAMIMRHEFLDRLSQRTLSEQDHSVQAGFSDRSDKPLRVGIQIWRPGRQLHGLYATGGQRPEKLHREQRVAAVDQILLPRQEAVPRITEIPDYLVFRLRSGAGSKPCSLRMLATAPRATTWPGLANAPWIIR